MINYESDVNTPIRTKLGPSPQNFFIISVFFYNLHGFKHRSIRIPYKNGSWNLQAWLQMMI